MPVEKLKAGCSGVKLPPLEGKELCDEPEAVQLVLVLLHLSLNNQL